MWIALLCLRARPAAGFVHIRSSFPLYGNIPEHFSEMSTSYSPALWESPLSLLHGETPFLPWKAQTPSPSSVVGSPRHLPPWRDTPPWAIDAPFSMLLKPACRRSLGGGICSLSHFPAGYDLLEVRGNASHLFCYLGLALVPTLPNEWLDDGMNTEVRSNFFNWHSRKPLLRLTPVLWDILPIAGTLEKDLCSKWFEPRKVVSS